MVLILAWCLMCALAFASFSTLVYFESVAGRRFFLERNRNRLDVAIDQCIRFLSVRVQHTIHYSVKLSWYYSIHRILRSILVFLGMLYERIEDWFLLNRARAQKMRAEQKRERSMLSMVAEHKTATALTPQQKKRLRAKKLKGE